jgi:hypothetical protein
MDTLRQFRVNPEVRTVWHYPCCLDFMHRSPLYLSVSSLLLLLFAALAAKARLFMDRQVPVGYQDESGFHLGIKSAGSNTDGGSFE